MSEPTNTEIKTLLESHMQRRNLATGPTLSDGVAYLTRCAR